MDMMHFSLKFDLERVSAVRKIIMDVSERLEARRAHLAPFCRVDPVKQHLCLQRYYQLARQLYRQSETYFSDGAWDNACPGHRAQSYVFLAKFIKLCAKVITKHKDYELPRYGKEREWVRAQTADGLKLFNAILDGMEVEELEYLEYEQSLVEKKEQIDATDRAKKQENVTALEDRLQAMRLAKMSVGRQKVQDAKATEKEDATLYQSAPIRSQLDCLLQPRLTERSKSVLYPSVGKASWMTADAGPYSCTHVSAPPLSRQRSQEAIAILTSGKIRTLEIPTDIIAQFTLLAAPNTNKPPYGIETCGILAGILHDQKLVITTLIIPKQEGSSDMCTMTNEEELYDFCFSNELLTLGWIHTHPKQDCFLSSVDVHTQCGFQSILPEAVAVVVAPSDPHKNVGVFRLTEPNGLQLIQNCNLTGFHTHPSQIEIYSNAFECKWLEQFTAQLVDMR